MSSVRCLSPRVTVVQKASGETSHSVLADLLQRLKECDDGEAIANSVSLTAFEGTCTFLRSSGRTAQALGQLVQTRWAR